MNKSEMKKLAGNLMTSFHADSLFRKLNKNQLLIVTYHGICEKNTFQGLFTQLPVDIFSYHLHILRDNYNIISLKELLECFKENKPFPERSAMITFDDGFMNNYTLAFPLLQELNMPAVIFLTVDYIGTNKLLWFDELYLLIKEGLKSGVPLGEIDDELVGNGLTNTGPAEVYSILGRKYKRLSHEECSEKLTRLKGLIEYDNALERNHFRMLTWEQVREMHNAGLIDFGVHTANHRILSGLKVDEWESEIVEPKEKLAQILDCEISSFCYPNGIPDVDFREVHENFLKKTGYKCAFSTGEWLNHRGDDPFRLGRIPVGNDLTSDKSFFRLNMSGFVRTFKKLCNK